MVPIDFTKRIHIGLAGRIETILLGYAVSGIQDYESTIDGIRLYDNNGNQISDFLYKSYSHSRYNVEGGTYSELAGVPEPSTMALFGTALAAVVLLRRSRS